MMIDSQIQSFLDRTSLDDEEYDELVEDYFRQSKTSWRQEIDEEIVWDEDKVMQFWQLLRKHIMSKGVKNGYYDFTKFVFPKSEKKTANESEFNSSLDFWNMGEPRVFETAVSFFRASFLGELDLENVVFKGEANFLRSKFLCKNDVFFSGVTFWNKAIFERTEFGGEVYFHYTLFSKSANFLDAVFASACSFFNAGFSDQAFFVGTEFGEGVDFVNTHFSGDTRFFGTSFSGDANFSSATFSETLFQDFKELSGLSFIGVSFPDSVIFRRIDLTKAYFQQADVSNVQFKECHWGNAPRMILQDESSNYKKNINYYKGLESLYRQLKRNFDSNNDWELSGKAYVSEMEMRKKRYRLEGEKLLLNIFRLYALLGYAHNIKRPFYGLIMQFLAFAIIYFFIDYNLLWAMQRSIYGSLPKLITIPDVSKFNDYWLIPANIQSILCLILLTFFILSLRKRFR